MNDFEAIVKRIGLNVKILRTEKGISQREFSRITGINRSYLQQLESGQDVNPSIKILCIICDDLEVSLMDLIHKDHQSH
ncbi:helix-turn-helix domain-containing protein [Membranihabitans maritimus]|uniref:helix-turn-helix domain-containing protein n=1 Tax=Membranihabitans maritimus TaxID=2904244 RepID=UPI001F22BFE0|nr:helix-turn-helix transcriptional regulator [Membranihabitans maritimus]